MGAPGSLTNRSDVEKSPTFPPQAVDSTCGETGMPVEASGVSCGAICGTRRMSNFLRRTPCAPMNRGHRTSPPIHRRPGRKARQYGDRGPSRSEDPHREATRGAGPVTGWVGSESLFGREGRHRAFSPRGPLGAHTIERPSPCFRFGIGSAGPRGGDRAPAGLPEGVAGPEPPLALPEERVGNPGSPKASAGGDADPDHRRFCRRWKGPGRQHKLHTARQLAASAR